MSRKLWKQVLPNITESVHAPPGRRAHHIRAHPRAQDPHMCAPSHFTWARCREKIHPLSTREKTKAWAGFSGHSCCFWVEEGWEPIPTGPCCPPCVAWSWPGPHLWVHSHSVWAERLKWTHLVHIRPTGQTRFPSFLWLRMTKTSLPAPTELRTSGSSALPPHTRVSAPPHLAGLTPKLLCSELLKPKNNLRWQTVCLLLFFPNVSFMHLAFSGAKHRTNTARYARKGG